MKSKEMLAKAIYDNIADSNDEITFRRGDVLTVVEQDTQGLDGWWLCSLRGKRGIAPGNRLKLIGSYFDNAAAVYHTPSPGQHWNRRSWHQKSNKVVTPHKVGDVYVYDQPNKSFQDYDVPPSRYFPSRNTPPRSGTPSRDSEGNYSTPPSSRIGSQEMPGLTYDILPSSRGEIPQIMYDPSSPNRMGLSDQEVYDVPPSAQVPVGIYDMPQSNRSSTISMLSTGSTMTMSSSASYNSLPQGRCGSAPPSSCGSARSSLDISAQDIYDVPPTATRVVLPKRGSIDSALEIYDTPPKSKQSLNGGSKLIEDYDIPKGELDYDVPKSSTKLDRLSSECGEVYDVPPNKNKCNLQKEHAVDEDDTYDVPKNSKHQHSIEGVYDIPPQVTRDSTPSRVDSGVVDDIDNRLSSCSMDSRGSGDMPPLPYDELPLDLDAAMDLLVKLQQDVHTSTTRLLSFVSSTWRQRENLEPKLYEIKLACMTVKTSLQELVEFSQGALANSAKVEDKKLVHKLSKHLQPLQDSQDIIVKNMYNLDHIKWDVSHMEQAHADTEFDDLGQIITQSKELSSNARTIATLIQGNSTLLFKRSQKIEQGSSVPGTPLGKPPIKPKPKWTPSKSPTDRFSGLQDRPLPAPPPKERPLPPTPAKPLQTSVASEEAVEEKVSESHYNTPAKRLSDCKENVLDEDDDDNIYENDTRDWTNDYDYVALEEKNEDGIKPTPQVPPKVIQSPPSPPEKMKAPTTEEMKAPEVQTSGLSSKFKEKLEKLQEESKQQVQTNVEDCVIPKFPVVSQLSESDRQLLIFYSEQVETHAKLLTNATDTFFSCVEYNQPPKVFIANSKFVVVAAHKLVFIGDTLYRNITHEDVSGKIMHCANYLCECLKVTVSATKNAALNYPAIGSVQEMVDRVVDVSHAAHELKLVVNQASQL